MQRADFSFSGCGDFSWFYPNLFILNMNIILWIVNKLKIIFKKIRKIKVIYIRLEEGFSGFVLVFMWW